MAAPYTEPAPRATYPQLLGGADASATRSMAGALIGIGLFLLFVPVITQAVVLLGWAVSEAQVAFADYYSSALRFERPIGMLGANLGIATLIPISAGLMLVMHHARPAWLISVQARIRWRYAAACLVVAVLVLGGVVALSVATGPGVELGPQNRFWVFLLVIVLTSPLQAAAEEVFFRGYLSQALGALVTNPWFGVVASAVVFALFHGGQNLPLFLNRLAFGLLAGALVVITGGLEAPIAAHIVNNMLAYTTAGLTGSIAQIRGVSTITWTNAALDITGFALFAAAAWLLARHLTVPTTTTAP